MSKNTFIIKINFFAPKPYDLDTIDTMFTALEKEGFDIKYILPWKDEVLGEAPETEKEYNE
tara:strand:+ start:10185 stop:10367 length:183 start_codon:yes stop_codon:yes gene_type:complete